MKRAPDRLEAIRRTIREAPIQTQDELRKRLRSLGIVVTQATLSRDLAQLGARRTTRPGVGSVYELDAAPAPPPVSELFALGPMVVSIRDNGQLVVIHTVPGAASAIARAIDLLRVDELIGTLAGDDTIFLAPKKGARASRVCQKLARLFGKESSAWQ